MPETRGKARIFKVFRFLREVQADGATDLGRRHEDVRRAEQAPRARGARSAISTTRAASRRGINVLRYNKFDPFVVHVVDPAEGKPKLHGDVLRLRLRDGRRARGHGDRARCSNASRAALREYLAEVERFCATHQVPYVAASVERAFRRADPARVPAGRVPPVGSVIFAGLPSRSSRPSSAPSASASSSLYILKLRRRAVAVPFSPLWERILRDKEATSLFSKLKRCCRSCSSSRCSRSARPGPRRSARRPRASSRGAPGRAGRRERVDAGDRRVAQPPRRRQGEVKKIVRGLGGADRMLVAQMDAMVTPLGPMTRRHVGARARGRRACARPTRAPISRVRCASRPTPCAASTRAEIVVVSDGALGRGRRRVGAGAPGRREAARSSRSASGSRNVGDHAVFGAPLSARQEPLRGDARAHQHRRPRPRTSSCSCSATARSWTSRGCACSPGERLPRFYPSCRAPAARSRPKIALADGTARRSARRRPRLRPVARAPAREGARGLRRATRTSRRRCCSTSTST